MDSSVLKYNLFKLFHIIGIVVWLGPSTGVYYMIIFSIESKQKMVEMWLRQEYISFIYLETAGFALIIISGFLMVRSANLVVQKQWWLKMKLFIVISVFLPLEAIQLSIYHWKVSKAFISGTGTQEALLLYDWFSVIALVLLTITVPVVFLLGIYKPVRKIIPRMS